ncbi:hypothetical protein, partial [Paenibacillus riograndensis]
FRIMNETVDILRIVYILSIEHRSKDTVFKLANRRLAVLKKLPKQSLHEQISARKKWSLNRLKAPNEEK